MKFNMKKYINEIPDDLTDIEKIRKIYLRCGELFSYNRDYTHIYSLEKSQQVYDEPFNWNSHKNRKDNKKINVTCKQIASGCIEAINELYELGKTKGKVRATNIGYQDGEQFHVATLVFVDDDVYFLDLYKDLFRIQNGFRTKYFAPPQEVLEREKKEYPSIERQLESIQCKSLSNDEIFVMDKKCGYNVNGVYMDDVLDVLRKEMQDEENIKQFVQNLNESSRSHAIYEWKMDFICRYLLNNSTNNMGISELSKNFYKIYYGIMTNKEIKENIFSPMDIHYKGEPSILLNFFGAQGSKYYIYKGKKLGFEKIDKNEFKRN